MKAFKQFTFHREHRMVWSYSAAVLLLSLFVMLRPVVAQQEENLPEVKVEVKGKYDENGKLTTMDTVRTWNWSAGSGLNISPFCWSIPRPINCPRIKRRNMPLRWTPALALPKRTGCFFRQSQGRAKKILFLSLTSLLDNGLLKYPMTLFFAVKSLTC